MKTSPLLPKSSTENSIPCISKDIVSRVQEFTKNSLNQNFSENKRECIVNNHELPRSLGLVDSHPSHPSVAKTQTIAEERNTVIKVPEMALPLVAEESPKKMTPRESTGDIIKEAPPEGVTSWGSERTASDEPSFSANVAESSNISNGEIQECTDKTSVKKDVSEDVRKTTVLRGLLEKPSLTASKEEGTAGSEIVSRNSVITKDPKTSELRSLLEKASSIRPVNEETNSSKLKSFEQEEERLASAASEGLKRPSVKVEEQEVSKPLPSSYSRNSINDECKLSAKISEENPINNSQDVASNLMEAEPPVVLTKPPLGPGTKQLTRNCFSVFSSNSAEHNGELFANKELRTYSKKVTPIKRKSSSKESTAEGNSAVSKVFRVDDSKSPEIDIKKLVQENRKVEVSNTLLNSQPEQKMFENMVPSEERGKKSRKKSTGDSKLPTKKAKCEENKSNRVNGDSTLDESVRHEGLKDMDSNVVNSVSFVADQAVKDIAINHSPTMKDAPTTQFEVVKQNSERLSRSKERIREMTSKRKQLKAKEQNRIERSLGSVVLPVLVKQEPENGESFEKVVDSVLDEEIAVIYNGEGKYPVTCLFVCLFVFLFNLSAFVL